MVRLTLWCPTACCEGSSQPRDPASVSIFWPHLRRPSKSIENSSTTYTSRLSLDFCLKAYITLVNACTKWHLFYLPYNKNSNWTHIKVINTKWMTINIICISKMDTTSHYDCQWNTYGTSPWWSMGWLSAWMLSIAVEWATSLCRFIDRALWRPLSPAPCPSVSVVSCKHKVRWTRYLRNTIFLLTSSVSKI